MSTQNVTEAYYFRAVVFSLDILCRSYLDYSNCCHLEKSSVLGSICSQVKWITWLFKCVKLRHSPVLRSVFSWE